MKNLLNYFFKKPLKFQMAFVFCSTFLLYSLIMVIQFEEGQSFKKKETIKGFDLYSSVLSESVSQVFFAYYNNLQSFAKNKAFVQKNQAEVEFLCNELGSLYPLADYLALIDLQGKVLGHTTLSKDGKKLPESAIGYDVSNSEWFKATKSEKYTQDLKKGIYGAYLASYGTDPVASKLYKEERRGNIFATLVYDENSDPVAVLALHLNEKWLQNEILNLSKNLELAGIEQAIISISSKDKTFVSYNTSEKVFEQGEEAHQEEKDNTLSSQLLIDNPKFVKELDWKINIKVPTKEALGAIIQSSKIFYGTLSVVLLMLIFLIWGIYWHLNHVINGIMKQFFQLKESADNGELKTRANTEEVSDEFRPVLEALNTILDNFLNPIQEMKQVVQQMGEGDFTLRIQGDYKGEFLELRNSLNRSLNSIAESFTQVKGVVSEVASRSQSVNEAGEVLSKGALDQAASLEQVASTITQIGSQANQNAQTSGNVQIAIGKARTNALHSQEIVTHMVDSMTKISDASQDISKIIRVIDEIAFQTNLLALNAAVEAARAGKYGKGFAVVAEEVRNLAKRSAQAASETATLIEGTQVRVEEGNDLVLKTKESLEMIVQDSSNMNTLVEEITVASKEQAAAITQIKEAIHQVDRVVQNSTNSSNSLAQTSTELNQNAQSLEELVSQFKV